MLTLVSRRDLLAGAFVLGGGLRVPSSQSRAAAQAPGRLVANQRGGYLFVPGTPFFSLGAVAANGFEVVRATFRRPPAFPDGLDRVEQHLRAVGRTMQAVCGFELRNGRQATVPEFMAFNDSYIDRLRRAGMVLNGQMPLVRSNLVITGTDASHRIHAFSYTVPASSPSSLRTFVVAGIPEVRLLDPNPEIVARDDVSVNGLRQKTLFILETIETLLTSLSAGWSDVTGLQLYTVRDLHPLIESALLPRIGVAAWQGIQWHFVQLPVFGGDVEIDVRSVRSELFIDR
jgi:hypothetical protein